MKDKNVVDTGKRKIRILIADDHAVVRSGLRSILETEDDIEVVGEAADGHQALEFAQELLPDVILMDINMGDWDGVKIGRASCRERVWMFVWEIDVITIN